MARVRCIMMQKDEDLVLGAWIAFHGYQFGFENLTIFDNGSSSTAVIATLRQLERAGGRVIWQHDAHGDWLNKGKLVEYVVRNWDKTPDQYDFVFPLDCDEFLALFTENGLTCRRADLHAYLDGLIGSKDVFGVSSWSFNVPGQPGWFYPVGVHKRFFAAGTLDWIDHGYHNGLSRGGSGVRHTRFTYLHLHNKPFPVLQEHSRRKLASFVDVNDADTLRAYRGDNYTVAANLLMNEAEYLQQFDGKLQFEFTGLGDLLQLLGQVSALLQPRAEAAADEKRGIRFRLPRAGETPAVVEFDAERYLSENLDVAGSNHSALEHFILCGHAEGRLIRRPAPVPA